MPQLIAATVNHGEARYMLTGTEDFSYVLDRMIDDNLIVHSSTTATSKDDMLQIYDGYKLKFTMLGMIAAVNDTTDDTNAICLAS